MTVKELIDELRKHSDGALVTTRGNARYYDIEHVVAITVKSDGGGYKEVGSMQTDGMKVVIGIG